MSQNRIEKYERLFAAIQVFEQTLSSKQRADFGGVVELFQDYLKQVNADNQQALDDMKESVNELIDTLNKKGLNIAKVQ